MDIVIPAQPEFIHPNLGTGRFYVPDARDLDHMVEPIIQPRMARRSKPIPPYRVWWTPPALDQKDSSACTGFSTRQLLNAAPNLIHAELGPGPHDIYRAAQLIDEWPGQEPEVQGSSVRAAAKVLNKLGYIKEYRWINTQDREKCHEELSFWILTEGPVVVGTNWYSSMFSPDKYGIVRPQGAGAGGHAYLCIGWLPKSKMYVFINSWGREWNPRYNGRFFIAQDDFIDLLLDRGEAMAAIDAVPEPVAPKPLKPRVFFPTRR
jgi:hypothetical protein